MAGITDGSFALKLIPYGFDVVTIGGYNTDSLTISAGNEILKRGRNEFDISKENLISTIKNEVKLIKDNYPQVKVSANLRSITPKPIIDISKNIKDLDIIEINCHCRQAELVNIGCGQGMLTDLEKLQDFVLEVVENVKNGQKVSVKIRANVPTVDTVNIAKILEKTGANYLHIDAMKPHKPYADLKLIKRIADETNIFIIGNNSIVDFESAMRMFDSGASGISIGRAAINGKLNFDISKI